MGPAQEDGERVGFLDALRGVAILGILPVNAAFFAYPSAAAATGRLAFTNYLLQSVVMTFLFYGSTIVAGTGLGLFGGVGRIEVLAIAAGLAAAQVAASVLWLRAFRMGPVEWIWRAATYLRFPPLLRRADPG